MLVTICTAERPQKFDREATIFTCSMVTEATICTAQCGHRSDHLHGAVRSQKRPFARQSVLKSLAGKRPFARRGAIRNQTGKRSIIMTAFH